MKPLIKWTGGKTRLLPHILQYLPPLPSNYFEPFAGGAALFFEYGHKAERAYLNDICGPLMDFYWYLPKAYTDIEESLRDLVNVPYDQLRQEFNETKIRCDQLPHPQGNAEQVARFIALNYLCFNGVYRENKKGEFNCPVGRVGKKPGAPKCLHDFGDERFEHLKRGAAYLHRAIITSKSFDPWPFDVWPEPGDVVFFDPPYLKEYSQYNKSGFGMDEHEKLAEQAYSAATQGATVIVCGSNNDASRAIYGEPTKVVELSRTVGHSKRKKATECLWVYNGVKK